jgi:hypothetical protein
MTCQSKEKDRTGYVSNSLVLRKFTKKAKAKFLAKHAVGAYCTQCEQCIPFSVSNPSNVSRHMDSVHSALPRSRGEEQDKGKIFSEHNYSSLPC